MSFLAPSSAGLAAALVLATGCLGKVEAGSGGADGGGGGGGDQADARTIPDGYPDSYDMNDLMSDGAVRVGNDISVAQVQDFLAMQGSYLAGYSDPVSGEPAAQLIVEQSQAHTINPIYMLARIQTESSLVTSGSDAYLDQATGCGCPDGSGCDPRFGGFGGQVECAAAAIEGYYADLDASGSTVSGWSVGAARDTGDPCSVTPANRATAALYTYTPWVGAYAMQCGRSDVGGSSLVSLSYYRFLSEYHWGNDP